MPKINRRDFFKIAATSGAAVAVASCGNDPVEQLVPLLVPPDDYKIGKAYHFSTVCQECSVGCGMVVKTREGRAVQVEGNPLHKLNAGKLCPVGQASLQTLYNPSRIKQPLKNQQPTQWQVVEEALQTEVQRLVEAGLGKHILYLGPGGASTLNQLSTGIMQAVGGQRLGLDLNPVHALRQANQELFGLQEIPEYKFSKAKVLLNFGADFLESWLSRVENTRQFTEQHAYAKGQKGKAYHIAAQAGLTGQNADAWIACKPNTEWTVALAVAHELLPKTQIVESEKRGLATYLQAFTPAAVSKISGIKPAKIKQLATEFGTQGQALAIGGGNASANQHQLALQKAVHLLNYMGGAIGNTVVYGADYQLGGSPISEIQQAIQRMQTGEVELLIIEATNPAYALPKSAGFTEALKNVKQVFCLSSATNETTLLADWVLPIATSFESFGDSFTRNGVYGLQQPVMAKIPGFNSKACGDILLQLAQGLGLPDSKFAAPDFKAYLELAWQDIQATHNDIRPFAVFWKQSLKEGGLFKDYAPQKPSLRIENFNTALPLPKVETGLSLITFNTSFHNANGHAGDKYWLLEIPDPITQVVWDAWVEIHPKTATELGIQHKDEVKVSTEHGQLLLAAYISYAVAPEVIAIPNGLGRILPFPSYSSRRSMFVPFTKDNSQQLENFKVGVNAIDLLGFNFDESGGDLSFVQGQVNIQKTGNTASLVTLDGQYRDDIHAVMADEPLKTNYGDRSQKSRNLVRTASLKAVQRGQIKDEEHHLRPRNYKTNTQKNTSFYQNMEDLVQESMPGKQPNDSPVFHDPYKFEMAIDLDRCTGCSACVVACYAENNVPVVGKERQALGREMSWIRIERYFEEDSEFSTERRALLSPQTCQHCGNAGCEPVCPVYATYHNPDGLNVQVYNRCVGTRYCANNCAYKQRRFNWRTYAFPFPLNMQLNPDVSVRSKGVMEKCTFCVQRIRKAKEETPGVVQDGGIKTACQTACPTNAIAFGNSKETTAEVSQWKTDERAYRQLEELNYQPAISYLRKVVHKKPVSKKTKH